MVKHNLIDISGVYKELRSSLMRYAFRYFNKPHDIEDVVQEAFIKVLEANKGREIQHPNSYLYQTVKNLALNKLKKSEHKLTESVGEFIDDIVLIEVPTLEQQFESRQKFGLFCRAVRQLPVKCQRVYILRKVYGFSVQEISTKMDISKKTIEAHLTKAIVRCTDFMEAEEEKANTTALTKKERYKNG
jgi:RNA polymerase sigma factor (sigma-70 family)